MPNDLRQEGDLAAGCLERQGQRERRDAERVVVAACRNEEGGPYVRSEGVRLCARDGTERKDRGAPITCSDRALMPDWCGRNAQKAGGSVVLAAGALCARLSRCGVASERAGRTGNSEGETNLVKSCSASLSRGVQLLQYPVASR